MGCKIAAELYDITLEVDNASPLYLQLYEIIKQQILSKRLIAGLRLPASRELACALKVSRNTVQRAYDQLITEGYLYAKPGSGVFVSVKLPDDFLLAKNAITFRPMRSNNNKSARLSVLAQNVKEIKSVGSGALVDKPFMPGMPDLSYFPQQIWLKLWHKSLRQSPSRYLSINETAGLWSLRQAVSDYLSYARAVKCQPEQVIITGGAQQALDLICRVFLDVGDAVICEDPAYLGMRNLLMAYRAHVIPCEVDDAGMQVDLLGRHSNENPKLLYTTPAHQYPLGSIMPIERRLQLLSFAESVGSYVIEDDYDGEFHFDCKPMPSLQGMDQSGRVIYVGSFSKVLLPSLRLGYLVVPDHLIEIFTKVKRLMLGFSEPIKQQVVADFIQQGHFSRHLKRMRLLYAERLERSLPLFHQCLGERFIVLSTGAGMHLVLMSHKKINDIDLSEFMEKQGYSCKALSSYYIGRKKRYGLVVGFSNVDGREMQKGIEAILCWHVGSNV